MNKRRIIIRYGKYINTFEAKLMVLKKWFVFSYWQQEEISRGKWVWVSLDIQGWKIEHGLTWDDITDETEEDDV